MRARSLKPGFFQNEDLIELPFEYRLLFAGIWTMADREGRLEDRPKKIKLNVFPGDNVDCEAGLVALQRAGFIQRYQIEGAPYVQINAFLKHQSPHPREAPSVIPPPQGAFDKFKHEPVTREQRERILARDGHKCVKCGEIERLHVDHIIAISRGGTSEDSNLRTLCWLCNGQKGAKSVAEHDQGSAKAQPRHGLAALTPSSLTPDSGLLTADSNSEVPTEPVPQRRDAGPVERVFEHWRQEHKHPKAVLDRKRRRTIEAALKLFDEPTLCQSISGYRNSPHHMGENDQRTVYDDIELFLRNATHVENGLKFARGPPAPQLSAVAQARAKLRESMNGHGRVVSEQSCTSDGSVGQAVGVLR